MVLKAILYALVVFALLYFSVKKRNSKFLFNILMLLCWFVIVLSMDSSDINNYRMAYDAGVIRGKEPLFDLLQLIFSKVGIPFAVFKVIYSTAIWALMYRALKKFTLDSALVAAIFVLGPMMGFGTQMRSSMAGAIIINAIPLLLRKDEKVWKYCIWVAVASLFHLMAVFYFIFLIPKYLKIGAKRFRNYMYILAIVLIPFFLVCAKPISNMFVQMQTWTNISFVNVVLGRFARYFSGEMGPNIKGFLFVSCGHFVVFFLADRMCGAMLSLRKKAENRDSRDLMLSSYEINYLRKLNSILLLIIPCYILSMQFDRFNNYFVPVCYCLIVQGARELRKTGHTFKPVLPEVKSKYWNWLIGIINRNNILQIGNIEITVLIACLLFSFFVNNRFSSSSEFVRIVNGIGLFNGPK